MRELIETIVKSIVDAEDHVEVSLVDGGKSTIIQIVVEKNDLGKVIGRHGKTVQSIRNIVYAASFKTQKKYIVDASSFEDNLEGSE